MFNLLLNLAVVATLLLAGWGLIAVPLVIWLTVRVRKAEAQVPVYFYRGPNTYGVQVPQHTQYRR